jgi:hypothetical protein
VADVVSSCEAVQKIFNTVDRDSDWKTKLQPVVFELEELSGAISRLGETMAELHVPTTKSTSLLEDMIELESLATRTFCSIVYPPTGGFNNFNQVTKGPKALRWDDVYTFNKALQRRRGKSNISSCSSDI